MHFIARLRVNGFGIIIQVFYKPDVGLTVDFRAIAVMPNMSDGALSSISIYLVYSAVVLWYTCLYK